MLQKDSVSDPEATSEEVNGTKVTMSSSSSDPKSDSNGTKSNFAPSKSSAVASSANPIEWEEVKKARNRINSQRTRERERSQIKSLEAERACLWLSNDAIKFQNRHFRETIAQILKVRDLKRSRAATNGAMGGGMGSSASSVTSSALAASLGAAGGLVGGSSMSMPMQMRHNPGMVGSLGGVDPLGSAHGGLFQSSRLPASVTNFNGLSDADLLARHQATTLEMQNMMRQQGAMERLGGGGNGMGGLNMSLNGNTHTHPGIGRMVGSSVGNPSSRGMNGMNMNGMNGMNPTPASYSDVADNIRIRQLMMQHSAAAGDFEPKGLISSIGAQGPIVSDSLGNGNGGDDSSNGNGNNLPFVGGGVGGGLGGLGDLGGISGVSDDILQMSKRQKFGY